jgi:DNA polymerase kappa
MDQVDAERVKRIVYEASVNSAFHQNERRKEAAADERTKETLERASRLTQTELARHETLADSRLSALEASRDLSRCWLVVDFDAFFASVEEQKDPSLKNRPMAVGGQAMICTANYEARKYGVRSAMPGFIAVKLCPQLVFVRPDFESYKRASALGREALLAFDPHLEMASLDEAYLDVTGLLRREREGAGEGRATTTTTATATSAAGPAATHDEVERLAERVRAAVRERTGGLTCSVGAAPNRTLAKICADLRKPDGQYVLPCFPSSSSGSDGGGDGGGDNTTTTTTDGCCSAEAVRAFVSSLPIRKIPGVGRVTERALAALGVKSCADVLERRALLSAVCSPSLLDFLFAAALGLGSTRHPPPPPPGELRRKGISCERTFSSARSAARGELGPLLEALVDSLADDMAREGLEARTLTLKLKLAKTFELRTRAATLEGGGHARTAQQMLPLLRRLLRAEGNELEVRLMGVRASGLRVTRERRRQEVAEAGGEAAAGGPIERMLARQQQQPPPKREWQEVGGAAAAPPPPPRRPAAPAARTGPSSSSSSRWPCGACTLLNPALSLRCEACGERKGWGGGGVESFGGAAMAATAAAPMTVDARQQQPKQEEEEEEDDGQDDPFEEDLLMRGEGDGDDVATTEEAEERGHDDDDDDNDDDDDDDDERADRGDPIGSGLTPGRLVGGGSASAYCDRCGARVDARDAQEHADYHVAEALELEERQAAATAAAAEQARRKGGQKRPAQNSIDRYFTKAAAAGAAAGSGGGGT